MTKSKKFTHIEMQVLCDCCTTHEQRPVNMMREEDVGIDEVPYVCPRCKIKVRIQFQVTN